MNMSGWMLKRTIHIQICSAVMSATPISAIHYTRIWSGGTRTLFHYEGRLEDETI
ncbi:hypothetical protein [Salimicrobium halophilum]|uniref:hypothetical protein n=1 Tax=Salimicrobium halophilum TaxID=86666 RepID=UPI0015A421D1|nr:hypothetical protein [Salimicrobium halophilum]